MERITKAKALSLSAFLASGAADSQTQTRCQDRANKAIRYGKAGSIGMAVEVHAATSKDHGKEVSKAPANSDARDFHLAAQAAHQVAADYWALVNAHELYKMPALKNVLK